LLLFLAEQRPTVILSPGPALQVPLGDLEIKGQRSEVGRPTRGADDGSLISGRTLADAEREHILGVLHETGWVVGGPKGAAARLGMKRSTLQKKMKKLDISRPE